MTIELTDGHEVFLIRKISSYDELDRLRYMDIVRIFRNNIID